MSQVLVHFDEATLSAIDRIAPAAKRQGADFVRRAVKDAISRHETERMQEAYRLQPDSAEGADTWELPEAWQGGGNLRSGGQICRNLPGAGPSFC